MFIISECQQGWNLQTLSQQSHYFKMTSDSSSETIDLKTVDLKDKKIALLIHGFNNSKAEIIETFKKIHQSLSTFHYDSIIGFVWPGFETRAHYFCAKARQGKLTQRLKTHLLFLKERGALVDIHAHSMGARLVCETLLDGSLEKNTIRHFHCIGPACEERVLHEGERFYGIAAKCQKVFVYHSEHDGVLNYGYFLLEWTRALGSIKYITKIDKTPPNVFFLNCSNIISHHNAYKDTPQFFKIAKELSLQTHLTCRQWEISSEGEISAIVEQSDWSDELEEESGLTQIAISAAIIAGVVYMTYGGKV